MKKLKSNRCLLLLLTVALLLCGCQVAPTEQLPQQDNDAQSGGESTPPPSDGGEDTDLPPVAAGGWFMGFAAREIPLPKNSDRPLYIAGYNQGVEISAVRDLQRANALWIDTGGKGVLLIGVDCIALASETVEVIRERLADFCAETGCLAVNVYATHTHAGVDTFGMWGEIGKDGKNDAFMENLIDAAVEAGKAAYADRSRGTLRHGMAYTGSLQRDSRDPQVYDRNLYQLRFVPDDAEQQNGIRMLIYDAHAESMRGDNTVLSRDFPGVVSDILLQRTGDDTMFLPGAVGGLIMTEVLCKGEFDAEENLMLTGERIAQHALSIVPANETEVAPSMAFAVQEFEVPLDNPLFLLYRTLGILGTPLVPGEGETGYSVRSSLSILQLGDVTLALLPCELFPELLIGELLAGFHPTEDDPDSLLEIAARYDKEILHVVGLCNDELGYVIPPSNYLVHPENPYFDRIKDETGEDHYEETNSVGYHAASCIAQAFDACLAKLTEIVD